MYSLLVPLDTPFDRGLAKLRLTRRDIRNVFLEFIGTMFFTLWGSTASVGGAPWANGLVLAAAIYLSDGGHINPWISLSALLTRNIKPHLFFLYVIAQITGGITGACWMFALLPSTSDHPGQFRPNGITLSQAFAWELLATMLFVLTVQSIALRFTSFSNPDVDLTAPGSNGGTGPLSIGFALSGIAWSLGQYTGASVNLARTLASAIIFPGPGHWITGVYVLAGLTGTLIASLIAGVVYGIGSPIVAIVQPGAPADQSERAFESIQSHVWTGKTPATENLRQRNNNVNTTDEPAAV